MSDEVTVVQLTLCCFCSGCAVLHIFSYFTCAVLQWVLYANDRAAGVECTENIALAAAILSSLAVLIKCVHHTLRFCSDLHSQETIMELVAYCAIVPYAILKIITICLVVLLIVNRNGDKCGSEDVGPPALLISLAVLEPGSMVFDLCTEGFLRLYIKLSQETSYMSRYTVL